MAEQLASVTTTREPYEYPASFKRVDGVVYFGCVSKELFEQITNLPVQDGDLFVATYLKAGTTWVSEILWQIFNGGKIDNTDMGLRIPFLEFFLHLKETKYINFSEDTTVTDYFTTTPPPRIFKTHLPYRLVPKGGGSAIKPKYVYVMRNPKDTAVSHYHHLRRIRAYQFDRTWGEYFEMVMADKTDYGSWFDHALGWWEHRDDPNILFLKYEDIKKDLEGTIRKIAHFVGKDLSEDMIKRIAHQTSFNVMKEGGQFLRDDNVALYVPGEGRHLRNGIVGDWRNYFTDEQNRKFDELYTNRMAGSGLELEF